MEKVSIMNRRRSFFAGLAAIVTGSVPRARAQVVELLPPMPIAALKMQHETFELGPDRMVTLGRTPYPQTPKMVFDNGVLLCYPVDYSVTGKTITLKTGVQRRLVQVFYWLPS